MIEKTYGLVGYPLGHSFSRIFFNEKFENEDIPARYVNFEIPVIEEFPDIFDKNPDIAGLNVTIPYKQQVIPHLDDLDPTAREIGAVNVVKVIRDNAGKIARLVGYNSDEIGFVESIKPMLGVTHRRSLVLGTGGASKAVCHGLCRLGITPTLVSRSASHSDSPGQPGQITYADITPEIMASHTVIVNTTPLGMHPEVDACPDIPYDLITPAHVCYDLVYNPAETLFMRKAAIRGASVKNGLEMLRLQALAAWDIWNR